MMFHNGDHKGLINYLMPRGPIREASCYGGIVPQNQTLQTSIKIIQQYQRQDDEQQECIEF